MFIIYCWFLQNAFGKNTDYIIHDGDSLSKISANQYQSMSSWPSLWAINNDVIKNPHHIYPGQKISLLNRPHDDNTQNSIQESQMPQNDPELQEWQKLPPQSWEYNPQNAEVAPNSETIDRQKNKNRPRKLPKIFLSNTTQPIRGKIKLLSNDYSTVGLMDQVVVTSSQKLKVGQRFCITNSPKVFQSEKNVQAFSYRVFGEIKIIAVTSEMTIGQILSTDDKISNENFLIDSFYLDTTMQMRPSEHSVKTKVLIDPRFSTNHIADFNYVILAAGEDDHIVKGNIFQAHYFSSTVQQGNNSIETPLKKADFIVIQTVKNFSLAIAFNTNSTVEENHLVHLVRNLSEYTKKPITSPLFTDIEIFKIRSIF